MLTVCCSIFANAFNMVPHQLLLHKSATLNIVCKFLYWIQNYLEGREQRIVQNGSTSTPTLFTLGVPQGSVLRPLLFLV